ncbi:ABC transporter ATP-binding protein [Corynebacterium bouchesdurhonense]|uniref:ABC transporter ATP-binding protein n=1 Tax=Corynebacterium bouchesdurhonense TaxID=1720192 RepID=UPI000834B9A1|nr:ABC transporter ATP-binding protein [Corynebacterium bouchesdurhonense]
MDKALVVDSVVKRFGTTTAVDGMTFSAERGEILALLGPNGAGKSTTLDMCEGFQRPTSGSIRVLGIDPATRPQQVRDRIGIMLQGGGSYSGVSVREMLRLAASYNVNPHDPDWLIELLGLEGVASTRYRRLSGGQQQRLSLALALIGRPELVFLDEPTAGLDTQSRNAVWDIVNALRSDGVTVILTTHLMDEAETLADKVVIVDRGRVIRQGTPAELTEHDDFPAITVDTASRFEPEALARALSLFDVTVEETRPDHYRITGSATPEVIAALAAEAARQDVSIRELSVAHRTLEDVFLDTTGRHLRS